MLLALFNGISCLRLYAPGYGRRFCPAFDVRAPPPPTYARSLDDLRTPDCRIASLLSHLSLKLFHSGLFLSASNTGFPLIQTI